MLSSLNKDIIIIITEAAGLYIKFVRDSPEFTPIKSKKKKFIPIKYLTAVYFEKKCLIFSTTAREENEPRHDKTNKVTVRPAKTQISLGIRAV